MRFGWSCSLIPAAENSSLGPRADTGDTSGTGCGIHAGDKTISKVERPWPVKVCGRHRGDHGQRLCPAGQRPPPPPSALLRPSALGLCPALASPDPCPLCCHHEPPGTWSQGPSGSADRQAGPPGATASLPWGQAPELSPAGVLCRTHGTDAQSLHSRGQGGGVGAGEGSLRPSLPQPSGACIPPGTRTPMGSLAAAFLSSPALRGYVGRPSPLHSQLLLCLCLMNQLCK